MLHPKWKPIESCFSTIAPFPDSRSSWKVVKSHGSRVGCRFTDSRGPFSYTVWFCGCLLYESAFKTHRRPTASGESELTSRNVLQTQQVQIATAPTNQRGESVHQRAERGQPPQSPTSESPSPMALSSKKEMASRAVPNRSPRAVKYGMAELSGSTRRVHIQCTITWAMYSSRNT